jgi:anthranilate synthase component 1
MLVDLGRNDLSRVCVPGSVNVARFMEAERYSHVTHLVSEVVGELSDGCTPFELLRACFPAGTVSGAPKVRAMQIVSELAPPWHLRWRGGLRVPAAA